MKRRIAILLNSKAGKGRALKVAHSIHEKLIRIGILFTVFRDEWPEQLHEFTDAWIVGGDGTLNFFINKYPNCNLPLFIFRGGTGNDFAWKLYGKKGMEECLSIALDEAARKVDAGICNGKYFLNGVGIGFDGEIVKSIYREKFFFKGHVAYYAAVVRKVFLFREKKIHVKAGDVIWDLHAFMLTVANGSRYGGGFLVAPNAKVDDGLLDVVLIPRINLFQRLKLLPGASKGKHLKVAITTRSEAIMIQAEHKLAAHYDGEAMEADNFEIHILPQKFLFRY